MQRESPRLSFMQPHEPAQPPVACNTDPARSGPHALLATGLFSFVALVRLYTVSAQRGELKGIARERGLIHRHFGAWTANLMDILLFHAHTGCQKCPKYQLGRHFVIVNTIQIGETHRA